jgi:hypothetical protein
MEFTERDLEKRRLAFLGALGLGGEKTERDW